MHLRKAWFRTKYQRKPTQTIEAQRIWDVLATWRAKAASTVTGHSLDCGHFLQEERPEETFEELQHFFATT